MQTCVIKIESWSYYAEEVIFQWDNNNDIAHGLNETLNQHYFTVEYVSSISDTGYTGISDGKKLSSSP